MHQPARTGFELEIALSLAAVPGWAPIGADAHRYREMLHGADGLAPAPEVLHFHQRRWGHVDSYDDFAELLDLSSFDPDGLVALAASAGADLLVVTARSADGRRWWAQPGADAGDNSVGRSADVVHRLAVAAAAVGMPLGIHYATPAASSDLSATTDELARTVVDDLVELRALHPLRAVSGAWPAVLDAFVDGELALLDAHLDVDVAAAGRSPGAMPPRWSSRVELRAPVEDVADGWVCRMPMGSGFGWNRIDPAGRRVGVDALVASYAEVVGRGGRLRVVVPITSDGVPDPDGVQTIGAAAPWISGLGPTLRSAAATAREDDVRLSGRAARDLLAVLPAGATRVAHPSLDEARLREVVLLVPTDGPPDAVPIAFSQDDEGIHLGVSVGKDGERPGSGLPLLYRFTETDEDEQIGLFTPAPTPDVLLGPLVADARPGDIVQLGDGRYVGPATVPAGVTLRGLGARRTTIVPGPTADGAAAAALRLSARARLEHATCGSVVVPAGSTDAMVLGCSVGGVDVGGDRATVRASSVRRVSAATCDEVTISRCRFEDPSGDAPSITIAGGADHLVEGCSIDGGRTGIRLHATDSTTVRGCTIRHTDEAISIAHTHGSHVAGNRIEHVTRAVEVEGGDAILVDGNAVCDADSGTLVHGGATNCEVSGNYWEACRLGLLVWHTAGVRWRDNTATDLGDDDGEPVKVGP